MFGGLRLDFNRTKATDIQNSGIGIILQYDSRDFEVNVNSGILLNFVEIFYGNPINSDFNYRMYVFDYRQFKTIF